MATQSDVRFEVAMEGARFEVVRFELQESLSALFRLSLELSSADMNVDADALLDGEAVFRIERNGATVREVHGIVTAFEQSEAGFRRTRYTVVVEPALARLALWHGSRIHQLQSVPELLAHRLKERRLHAHWQAGKAHAAREYCVQYRETDLAFFARNLAEEGLVWYFDAHAQSQLNITDRLPAGPHLEAPVRYVPDAGGDAEGPHLRQFAIGQQLAVTRTVQRDYTFKDPAYGLQHQAQAREGIGEYEHFDAPGRYKRDESGKPFTARKLAALRNEAITAQLQGDDARLWPGLGFTVEGEGFHESDDDFMRGADSSQRTLKPRDWRIVSMQHIGEQSTSQEEDSAAAPRGTHYAFSAVAVPAGTDWQPSCLPRPLMDGPQMAHVVGPPDEEIHTDEHGRVMVWFPWDRNGAKENSSCWMRVSQGWAGAGYGMFHLPRIGQEVIVSFLDGDPDQPLITGCAFNAAQRPPYALPRHKTRSTWKSQTHKGEGSNEIRFEDEAGQEEIHVHAQKDRNAVIEHDQTTRLGHDRGEDIGNDERIRIGHDRTETVGGNETLSIGQDRRESLGRDHRLEVGGSRQLTLGHDLIEEVGNLRQQTTATDWRSQTGGHFTHTVAGRVVVEAGQYLGQRTRSHEIGAARKVVMRGPGGTITLDDNGVRFDAIAIRIKGPVSIKDGGVGNALSITGNPADPVCVECLLKAIAEQRGVIKFGG